MKARELMCSVAYFFVLSLIEAIESHSRIRKRSEHNEIR